MPWWTWMLLGLGLLALEIATPGGFFVLFFGVAALAVGLLVGIDAGGPPWVQWLLFSLVSIGSLVLFRGRLLRGMAGGSESPRSVDSLIGEEAVLLEDLPPGGVGKAELRGTAWNARNAAPRPLARGSRARVERVDGLTLWLRET